VLTLESVRGGFRFVHNNGIRRTTWDLPRGASGEEIMSVIRDVMRVAHADGVPLEGALELVKPQLPEPPRPPGAVKPTAVVPLQSRGWRPGQPVNPTPLAAPEGTELIPPEEQKWDS
jgi:hypothetical protein